MRWVLPSGFSSSGAARVKSTELTSPLLTVLLHLVEHILNRCRLLGFGLRMGEVLLVGGGRLGMTTQVTQCGADVE